MSSNHIPVLLEETVQALNVQPGGRYIDCTLGGGGHALKILENSSPGGQLMGIDADPDSIRLAEETLQNYRGSILIVNDNFVNLQRIAYKYDFFPVHGILFDLGISSFQLRRGGRGISFQHDAPLDMRFNPRQALTAEEVLNTWPEMELTRIFRDYGEEPAARFIAREIVRRRPLKTTFHLVEAVEKATGGRQGKIHPATRTFQALRIAVNRELEHLQSALSQAVGLLGFQGRLVVISYHSLEDRIVKHFMQEESRSCICPPNIPVCSCGHKPRLQIVTKKVIVPTNREVRDNPRSRSAKLRTAERIFDDDPLIPSNKLCSADDIKNNGWRRPALLRKLQREVLKM